MSKRISKKRQVALEKSLDFYEGNSCPKCKNKVKYTKTGSCNKCYTITGMILDMNKRKKVLIDKIKAQAKYKGVKFDLSVDDIEWVKECPILKINLDYFSSGRNNNTVSFDRKDSSIGYVKGNVYVISNKANSCKSDLTVTQIERMLEYVKN